LVDPGSHLASILGTTELKVNSLHHQAVRGVAPGFRAVAHAPDGVVEGIERSDHPFAMAVQYHPEELVHFHAPSERLLRRFIAATADQ
jgi:putative glutamine amidotransferase